MPRRLQVHHSLSGRFYWDFRLPFFFKFPRIKVKLDESEIRIVWSASLCLGANVPCCWVGLFCVLPVSYSGTNVLQIYSFYMQDGWGRNRDDGLVCAPVLKGSNLQPCRGTATAQPPAACLPLPSHLLSLHPHPTTHRASPSSHCLPSARRQEAARFPIWLPACHVWCLELGECNKNVLTHHSFSEQQLSLLQIDIVAVGDNTVTAINPVLAPGYTHLHVAGVRFPMLRTPT